MDIEKLKRNVEEKIPELIDRIEGVESRTLIKKSMGFFTLEDGRYAQIQIVIETDNHAFIR